MRLVSLLKHILCVGGNGTLHHVEHASYIRVNRMQPLKLGNSPPYGLTLLRLSDVGNVNKRHYFPPRAKFEIRSAL